MKKSFYIILLFFMFIISLFSNENQSVFLIGNARTDITTPIVEVSTGYNNPGDIVNGLAMRLYSRAFIIEDPDTGKRVVFAVNEMLHMYQSVKVGVVKRLAEKGYGEYYNTDNILLSATHGHAIPSNNSWYTLFNVFNGVQGFDKLHYYSVVEGIVNNIIEAHHNMRPGIIKIVKGTLKNGGYNRSSLAYKKNIDCDNYSTDIDETMILIKFEGLDGEEIGQINWYGVHGTSLGITNRRVHSDNKGYAAYTMEKMKGRNFVAAFAQSTIGDVSPNMPNPEDITLPFLHPHELDSKVTMAESAIIHGKKQLDKALELYNNINNNNDAHILEKVLDYRHKHVDFNSIKVAKEYIGNYYMPWDDINNARTHTGVVGAAVAAGNEEGAPAEFAKEGEIKNTYVFENGVWIRKDYDLSQLNIDGTDPLSSMAKFLFGDFWSVAELVLVSEKYKNGQQEKVVLLPVGNVEDFWIFQSDIPFVPTIAPLQIIQIGDFAIVGTPFEITTMTGRRLKKTLLNTLKKSGINDLVIMSQTNAYLQYMTTREEYAEQHYEASFNDFGPFSSAALRQELDKLAEDLVNGISTVSNVSPRDLSQNQIVETHISQYGVFNDGGDFGKVIKDVNKNYSSTYDSVQAVFQGAHPRTILELKYQGQLAKYYDPENYTFLEIQKKSGDNWVTIAKDDDPYTCYDWFRTGGDLSATSEVHVTWEIRNAAPGQYRIKYNGLAKINYLFFEEYRKFNGISQTFDVQ